MFGCTSGKALLTSALLLATTCHTGQADGTMNQMGCVDGNLFEEGKDYFPAKVAPEDSDLWSVEYHNTYKIVTSHAANEKYLLYQCGTAPPQTEEGEYDAILSIPLTGAGVLYTTMIPYFELLGIRSKILAILGGSAAWVSSPCLQEMIQSENVLDIQTPPTPEDGSTVGAVETPEVFVPVAFVGASESRAELNAQTSIREAATTESTQLGTLEWVKFYSLFFNMEHQANIVYDRAQDRYMCVERNANLVTSDGSATEPAMTKPTVLWAQYSDYCGGWDVARDCPNNYYCELATSCSSTLLWSNEGSHFNVEDCGERNYMTTEEFMNFANTADYWIYTSSNWDATLEMFGEELQAFPSVQNQQVYDYQGRGSSAWFEQRIVEPDVILQDFCAVVGTDHRPGSVSEFPHIRTWFRNVFTEPVGDLGTCTDVNEPLRTGGSSCVSIPPLVLDVDKPGFGSGNPAVEDTESSSPISFSIATFKSIVIASVALIAIM